MNARTLSHQAVLVTALAVLSGCAGSMAEVLREKQEGQGLAATYSMPASRAWEMAETILRWDGAGTIEEHRDGNFLLTTIYNPWVLQGADPVTYVGAWIEPEAGNLVKLTCVVSGPKASANYTADDFQRRFQQAVELTRAGQPLPLRAPPRPRQAALEQPSKG
jgi:hypothetical protein